MAVLVVFVGIPLLVVAISLIGDFTEPVHPGITLALQIIVFLIVWKRYLRIKYHVRISSAAGDLLVLTSKNKAYIEHIVVAINDAIVRQR